MEIKRIIREKKVKETLYSRYKKIFENYSYPSLHGIGEKIEFCYDVDNNKWTDGLIIGISFTPAKVFYSIVDDYYGSIYKDVDSGYVRKPQMI